MKTTKFIAASALFIWAGATFSHESQHKTNVPVVKEQKDWGIAGDAKSVQRTLRVTMSDKMRFTPDLFTVKQGETVRLVVKNPPLEPTNQRKFTMTRFSIWVCTALLATTGHALAQTPTPTPVAATSAKAADMTEAEVRKVDVSAGKITLKHGPIKHLDMPPMSMVFQVKDPALLAKVKAGDKVRFTADKINGAYTVLTLEPTP
jgi:Cu/Ag efflux protein CusF